MIPCTVQDIIDAGGCTGALEKFFTVYPGRSLTEVIDATDYSTSNTRSEAWTAIYLLGKAGHFTEAQDAVLNKYLQEDAELVLLEPIMFDIMDSWPVLDMSQKERLALYKDELAKQKDKLWAEFVAVTESITWQQ